MINHQIKRWIALGMAILFVLIPALPVRAQSGGPTFVEGGSPVSISDGLSLTGGQDFGDGELRLSLSNGTTFDQLTLTSAADPEAEGAISVDSSGSVFLGNGSGRDRIGSISSSDTGENGKDLAILFSSPLANSGFESGDLTGWTPFEQNYSSVQNLQGQSIDYDFRKTGGGTGRGSIIVSTPSAPPQFTISLDPSTVAKGSYALRLVSNGNIVSPRGSDRPSGNGSLHGPYVRSAPFQAFAGDSITLDFSAQQGSDAYEVLGFLIGAGPDGSLGTGDDSRSRLFAKRGDTIGFTSVSATLPADGQYQFEFVCGSYDKTGGLALGASLFVDNVRLLSATTVNDQVIQAIADRVTFANTSEDPDTTPRELEVSRRTATQDLGSETVQIQIQAINDGPTLPAEIPITVDEGGSVVLDSSALAARDPDSASTDLIYTVVSGADHGQVQRSGTEVTEFTQADVEAGIITFVHDGSETTEDGLQLSLSDGGADGASPATSPIVFTITPQNDPPSGLTLDASLVNEGQPAGTPVGQLSTTDPDVGDSHSYSLVSGAGDTDNSLFQIVGDQLQTAAPLDGSAKRTYSIRIQTDDGQGGQLSQSFEILLNSAPTVENPLADRTVTAGQPFTLPIPSDTFQDGDGDPITLSARLANGEPLPDGLSFDPSTGEFSGTADPEDRGTFSIEVTATDSKGAATSDSFDLVINVAPELVGPLEPQAVTVGSALSVTVPDETFADADGDPLTLSASLADGSALPSWLSFDPATGEFSGTPGKGDMGGVCVQVIAADGRGGQVAAPFSLTVRSPLSDKDLYEDPDTGHLYYLTEPTRWTDAQAEAESVDGNLVTINDEAEHDFLWSSFGRATPFWIGLTDREEEGSFAWVSGQEFDYDYWAMVKPDSGYYGGEDLDSVVMNWRGPGDYNGGWGDVENDGPDYGEPVPGIVEVEPETLGYSLNLSGSDKDACATP